MDPKPISLELQIEKFYMVGCLFDINCLLYLTFVGQGGRGSAGI